MKSEDFKELQEFCEQKGYQLLNESLEDNTKFFVVSKKVEPLKKIKVKVFSHNDYNLMHRIDFKTSSRVEITKKEMDFLASALEKLFNNE